MDKFILNIVIMKMRKTVTEWTCHKLFRCYLFEVGSLEVGICLIARHASQGQLMQEAVLILYTEVIQVMVKTEP